MALRHVRPGGVVATLAGVCLALTAGCGGGAGDSPLFLLTQQKGMMACVPALNRAAGMTSWDTPVGMAFGMYYNQSWAPAKVMSVSLVDPRNLVVRGAVVYKMAQYNHAVPYVWTWSQEIAGGEPRPEWAARQPVPGAVIPPGGGPAPANFATAHPDVYQVVVEVQATARGDAWASGYTVTYRVTGRTYAVKLLVGLAIVDGATTGSACDGPQAAINADWNGS